MIVGPYHWQRGDATPEDVAVENPVGTIQSVSNFPYVYKILESRAVPQGGGMFEVSFVVEPASPEEAEAYTAWQYSKDDPESLASQARWYLWQKSWYSGIPADATIFCEAHQKMRPAHGANHYDAALVCNECVGKIERAIARKELDDPQAWITEAAAASRIVNFIDEAEKRGQGCFQLAWRKYIEIVVLYEFIRNSEYKSDWTIPIPMWLLRCTRAICVRIGCQESTSMPPLPPSFSQIAISSRNF